MFAETMTMNAWDQIKKELQSVLTAESYNNWVGATRFVQLEDNLLIVSVPDEDSRTWMENEYSDRVLSIARRLGLGLRAVKYVVGGGADRSANHSPLPADSGFAENDSASLNIKYTFDAFVVGPCNQFAHAAARSVANNPARAYNPLFIYGGTGMGKTHLLHAIGHALSSQHASMRVLLTSSERFMNDMITSIRLDRMSGFHQRYRSADVLLVDDVQLISNKERTQEEFFHTFNALHDHQKQIVISSDCPPKDIPGLVDRLRNRFEWGLMTDMQPPDLETKMAILDKKAEAEGVSLPEDVRSFMASRTKSNVRELEGALVKLMAYSSLTGTPINMPMAQQVLRHLVHAQDRRVTIDGIQKAVAERFDIKPGQLKEKSNTRHIVHPRQVAMYLVKELTNASLPEIGRAFGGKHHTTVMHSIRRIEKQRQNDPDLNRLLHKLIDTLQ